jgi:hypothetical protein
MAQPTFSDFVATERARLSAETEALEKRLSEIAREMKAIAAYERTRFGTVAAPSESRQDLTPRTIVAQESAPVEIKPAPSLTKPKAAAPATAAKTVPPATEPPKKKRTHAKRPFKPQSKGDRVIDLVEANPDGLTRGQIIEKLGARGDKVWEQSISNSLANLKRRNKLVSKEGRYVLA